MRRLLFLLVAALVAGCSWQQGYTSAQTWQRNQCQRLPDATERERCLANTAMSYDQYRRQNEKL